MHIVKGAPHLSLGYLFFLMSIPIRGAEFVPLQSSELQWTQSKHSDERGAEMKGTERVHSREQSPTLRCNPHRPSPEA